MAKLSVNEMDMRRQRAAAKTFAAKWLAAAGDEKQETSRFWLELLRDVLGAENAADLLRFEARVGLSHQSYIDVYLPGTHVIIEQKSAGVDLTAAKPQRQSDGAMLTPYEQAKRYADGLPYDERARWIVTCNFREFRIHDMSLRKESERAVPVSVIALRELPEQYHLLRFLLDTQSVRVEKEREVSVQAGELVSLIYNALLKKCPVPEDAGMLQNLNKFCVRLVFCLYAEDAGLFRRDQFLEYVKRAQSAGEMRQRMLRLFVALNRRVEERDPFDEELLAFPYVNGGLFADEELTIPMLDDELCGLIKDKASAGFNWRFISPTIFGGLFESTLNPDTRRHGGMHYTSVENIHKVIDPLFLDALRGEFETIRGSDKGAKTRKQQLLDLQDKIAGLTFLDPACGSGNFLTETFISLRRLENEILEEITRLENDQEQEKMLLVKVDIRQFHGIEINDFAVSVAKAALWIADAQMWEATREILHNPSAFLPLKHYNGIREGNALRLDWLEGIPGRHVDYIIGNPPFVGARFMSKEQKNDLMAVFAGCKNAGDLDFVSAWYKRAVEYMQGTSTRAALVSTNSITQGQQVALLWRPLAEMGCHIDFAHRTFKWANEARNTAAVHCVIVGFSCGEEAPHKILVDEQGEARSVAHINGYLVDAPDVFIDNRSKPLCDVPEMGIGNKPIDGGNYLFTDEEKAEFLAVEPSAAPYFHPWMGAEEFINGKRRHCLWLGDCSPAELRRMPLCLMRVEAVRQVRLNSKSAPTRAIADKPTRFHVENMPKGTYIAIPEVSSERRPIIPIGFMGPEVLCSNKLRLIPGATLYHFGVLTSHMHMAWTNAVCGRLKSDYQYSNKVVYNTFPWPMPTEEQKGQIEACAQAVLDARALYPDCSLADLYDPLTMPAELRKAHRELDVAVERAYGRKFESDAERVAHLFGLYRSAVVS